MPIRVFLGDLRYSYGGILANDCMPLGVAYIKAVMDQQDGGKEIDSSNFRLSRQPSPRPESRSTARADAFKLRVERGVEP